MHCDFVVILHDWNTYEPFNWRVNCGNCGYRWELSNFFYWYFNGLFIRLALLQYFNFVLQECICHHSTSVQFSNIHQYSYIYYVFCLRNYLINSITINFWRNLASSVRLVNRVWAGWLQQMFFSSQILDQTVWGGCLITSFPMGVERCGLDMNVAVLLCVVLRLRIVNKQCEYIHTHTHTHTHASFSSLHIMCMPGVCAEYTTVLVHYTATEYYS